MAKTRASLPDAKDRFSTVIARMVMTSGQNEIAGAGRDDRAAEPWMTDRRTPDWYPAAASPADAILMSHQVWETLRMYRADHSRPAVRSQSAGGHRSRNRLRELALSAKEELQHDCRREGIDSGARDQLDGGAGPTGQARRRGGGCGAAGRSFRRDSRDGHEERGGPRRQLRSR